MIDKRRFFRVAVNETVEFFLKGKDSKTSGEAKDISLGGMFVETESPLRFGAEIIVEAKLPGQKVRLTLPGVVRWVDHGGMGIQFGLLGARETHAITEFVHTQQAKEK